MQLPVGLLLLAFASLLNDVHSSNTIEGPNAQAGGETRDHLGEVSVNNGEESKADVQSSDLHQNGMEDAVQRIQQQVEADNLNLTGNVADIIKELAAEYVNGSRKGEPTDKHSSLEAGEGNSTDGGNLTDGSLAKRQWIKSSRQWVNGVVPYTFADVRSGEMAVPAEDQVAIVRAMKYYEATTCLRFPECTATVHEEFGLSHVSCLRYIVPVEGGCWSFVGRLNNDGQAISCCGSFGVCLHEIGHAIGLFHEQDRADRDLYVAQHPENASPEHYGTFSGGPNKNLIITHDYDLGSMMHYGMYGFSYNGEPTLTVTDPTTEFLLGNKEGRVGHYDLMGITSYYECTAQCSDAEKALQCENDGFVDAHCKCKCSALFSGDLCEKLYIPAPVTAWPTGSYGLPSAVDGCPAIGTWATGSRTHITESGSRQENGGYMTPFTSTVVVDHFCMKSDAASGSGDWPAGTYCIYQQGDSCPTGFQSGFITLDDDNESSEGNEAEGSLPKGVFNEDTQYFYCCRDDGDTNAPIELPRDTPFHLFRYGSKCQSVGGMLNVDYYLRYSQESTSPITTSTDPRPSYKTTYGDVWVKYCYYQPLNYDCGGIFELNDANPTVQISSPNYPENYNNMQECTWYIKAPEGSHVVADIDDFDLEEDSDRKCLDSVEIRSTLIGQPGEKYCGQGFKRSVISTASFMIMVLRTDMSGTMRGFTSTVRLISDHEQCYNIEDRGVSYRGSVDYTQHYEKCIPWEKAKQCSVNPFASKYIHSGLTGNSKCRNPNNLLRPWCYINDECEYDFCDVCEIAKCYDFFDDCEEFIGHDHAYCTKEEAFHGCHKTCGFCGWGYVPSVPCGPPMVLDMHAVIDPAKAGQATFDFGETVDLVCNDNGAKSELMCTTDGQYEGMELVCGIVCPDGWARLRENCYKFVETKVTYQEAKDACAAENGHLVGIGSQDENEFVQLLASGMSAWIGINDMDGNGVFDWTDGRLRDYTNWRPDEPSGGGARCTVMLDDGTWDDFSCTRYPQEYICKKPHQEYERDYYCVDEDPNCVDILGRNPEVCNEYREYSFAHCRHSCGFCPEMECPNPGLVPNAVQITTDSYIQTGDYFKYECASGYELESGNLGRICLRDDIVTGTAPVCKPEDEFEDTYGPRVIPRRKTEKANMLTIYDSDGANIKRNGKVIGWDVYSTVRTTLLALVWRRDVDETFTLIGQTLLTLRPKRVNSYTLKSFESFYVQDGDLIGWYTLGKQGLQYSDCNEGYDHRAIYQKTMTNMDEIQVGGQWTLPLVDTCRTYSIAVNVGGGDVGTYSNVAAASRGATCVDASSNKEICGLAIDGGLVPFSDAWMTQNEGIGSFIRIEFDGEYELIGARFMQRISKTGQNQRLSLMFSDGSMQQVGLIEGQGESALDAKAAVWNTVDLTPVASTSIDIMVDSVYSTDNNGFIEIEIYAGCAQGCTPHRDSCYKIEDAPLTWLEAESACQAYNNGHLGSITSQEENDFVTSLLTATTWIGFNDRDVEDDFTWTDGSDNIFTAWKSGAPNNYNNQDCVDIITDGQWNDNSCSQTKPYLCERPVDSVKDIGEAIHGNPAQPREGTDSDSKTGYIFMELSEALTIHNSGSIKTWKLYSDSDYDVTMMVLRPSQTDEYTLVGENTVSIKGGVTNLISIEPFDRIHVEAGDVISWNYLPGQSPGILYDGCGDSEVRVKYMRHPTSEPLNVGDTLMATGDISCRTYSISYIMTDEQPLFENVAALTSSATCSEASSAQSTCYMALDGKLNDWDSSWIPDSPAVAQYFDIKLPETHRIVGGRIMQRMSASAQIKSINIADTLNWAMLDVQLRKRQGSEDGDFRAQMWDPFSFDQPMETDAFRISISELHPEMRQEAGGKAGIIEIQLFSTGCSIGWTRLNNNCYKETPTVQPYNKQETSCQEQGAHVSSVQSQEENNFLLQLSNGKAIYLGYMRSGGDFVAADGSTMTYANWDDNQPSSSSCMALNSNGKWRAQSCKTYGLKPAICKKSIENHQQLPYSFVGNAAEPRQYKDGSGSTEDIFIENSPSMTFTRSGSVKAWKLYSTAEADIIMRVVRPVEGSDSTFTIIGENLVKAPAAKTDVTMIAPLDRINVEAGDIISWFYFPGSDPTIPYTKCATSPEVQIIWSGLPTDGPFLVGQEVTGTITTYRPCRTYSISAILDHETVPVFHNVALGASCTASTSPSTCSLAVDGGMLAFSSTWISHGGGPVPWLELTLSAMYPIIGSRIQQRLASSSRIELLEFSFSDASIQTVTFKERFGKDQTSYGSKAWDVFELQTVYTTSVRLTALTSYGTDEVGFIEVQLLSDGCIEGWSKFRDSCYKVFSDTTKSWNSANEDCISQDAHLVTLSDQEENDFVQSLISRNTLIGYHLIDGIWTDALGEAATFLNWKPGKPQGSSCVSMYYSTGLWDDQSCTGYKKNWICEKAAGVSVTPTKSVGGAAEPRSRTSGDQRIVIADRAENHFTEAGTVSAWKVYGKRKSLVVLSVYRPVPNTPGEYIFVGSNLVETEEDRVTYVTVPESFQINVLPNDVIGMQFPDGAVGVPYDSCNNNDVNMDTYELKSGWSNPYPGQTLTMTSVGTYYPCRTFSVSAIVEGVRETPGMTNIGTTGLGTTCEASDNAEACGNVMDGDIAPASEWKVTTTPVTGNWIKLTFSESYTVEAVSFMQRYGAAGQSQDITLDFSDFSSQIVTLKQRLDGSFTNTRNGFWDNFALDKVDTTFIQFTITSVYTESQNGFVEIKVFAGCTSGFVRYQDHCYELVQEKPKYYPAKDRCIADGAMLVRVDDAAENEFLRDLAGGENIWIGYRDNSVAAPDGVWGWEEDDTPYTYTNWAQGEPNRVSGSGLCATLDTDGLWRDHYCKWYGNYWFVCEREAPRISGVTKRELNMQGPAAPNARIARRSGRLARLIERENMVPSM